MLKLALVGKDISHSKSQKMYENILKRKIDYRLLDYPSQNEINTLDQIFDEIDGLSITSPYKTHFLAHVEMSPDIESLGAINCICKKEDLYYGTNTDYLAVKNIISGQFMSKSSVILGDGVMARVTIKVLEELGLEYKQYSRRSHGDLNQVDLSGKDKLIINTCSRSFEFNNHLSDKSVFWDYNYSFSPHSDYFKHLDIQYIDGLEMLHLQALYALKFWGIAE